MASKRDYYEILEVTKTASVGDIKASYRKLALRYHPDRNPGDASAENSFKEASEAYDVLSDNQKKQIYDQYGHKGLSGQGFSGFSDVNDVFSSFGSIFEDFFGFSSGGGGRGARRARRGADLRYDLELEFEESIFGVEKEIEFERPSNCEPCSGTGVRGGGDAKTCGTCGGHGQVQRSQGFFAVQSTCPTCGGHGKVITDPCPECKGRSYVNAKRKLNIKVPPGVDNGLRLRVSQEGEPGDKGGQNGDLYVVLHVKENDNFVRDGSDLIMKHKIGIAQAALGCQITIQTLDDTKTIEIPAGVQHGQLVTIPGLGVPSIRGVGRGDLHVEVEVVVPRKLSKEQKVLLQNFAEAYGEETQGAHQGAASFFHRLFQGH